MIQPFQNLATFMMKKIIGALSEIIITALATFGWHFE
jgi:hypothetical protein